MLGLGIGLGLGSGGASGGTPPIDLSTLDLTGLFYDYDGSGTWTGQASAGTSGSNNLINLTAVPPDGDLNGHGYVSCNGTNQALYHATASTFLDQAAFTISVLCRGRNPQAPSVNAFSDAAIIGSDLPRIGAPSFTTGGVNAWRFDGSSYPSTADIALAADEWGSVDITYDGTTLSIALDRGTPQTVLASPNSFAGALLTLGYGYSGYTNCDVAELITAKSVLDADTLDAIYARRVSRYAL